MDFWDLTEEEQREGDEIARMAYEEGLETDQPWALEAYEYRQAHSGD
jgi:hypothetical protein